MMRDRSDSLTPDILNWQPPQVAAAYPQEVTGRGSLDSRIARGIAQAMGDARDRKSLSREDLAEKISERLGRRVSAEQLYKFSSEASERHRIPLDVFMALVAIADAVELINLIAAEHGLAAIPSKYAPVVELHLYQEHMALVTAQCDALKAKVKKSL